MAKKERLTLIRSSKPQLRKRRANDWSKAKAREFLSVLSETCNVSEACRQSGLGMTVAYRRRKSDAAFRAAWGQAVAAAYQRLELVLLNRAFTGTEKVIRRRDGSEERMMEYSNELGLKLLKMHRDTAVDAEMELPSEEIDEIRERLVRKLQRMKKRDEEQEAGSQQLRDSAARDADAGECDG